MVPIFRSALQARLLLHVLTTTKPTTAADLARVLDAPEPTVSREVRRLLDAGFLAGERIGRAVVLTPATDNPATVPLRQLLIITYGPAQFLEQALCGIDGIDAGYVHGSWAARYHGEPGPPPGDIDVIVVGRPQRRTVDSALDGVEAQLGREVNITYVPPERWQDPADPFTTQVRTRPLVELLLTEAAA